MFRAASSSVGVTSMLYLGGREGGRSCLGHVRYSLVLSRVVLCCVVLCREVKCCVELC